jgi:hypothetical protein
MLARGALVAVALLLAAADPAAAYVRSRTARGAPFCWPRADLALVLALGAPPPDLDRETLAAAATAAASSWSAEAVACTSLRLAIAISDAASAEVAVDRDNRITFRTGARPPCDPGEPPCEDEAAALAVTSIYVRASDGVVIGGDIELNAIDFRWADVAKTGGTDHADLQNVLTHELGHFIGLDHSCHVPGTRRLADHLEHEIPTCGARAPPEVQETTMFASSAPGETSKRDLAPDDLLAVCALFPAGAEQPCREPRAPDEESPGDSLPAAAGGGGCSTAPRSGPGVPAGRGGLAVVALVAALAALARRLASTRRRGGRRSGNPAHGQGIHGAPWTTAWVGRPTRPGRPFRGRG